MCSNIVDAEPVSFSSFLYFSLAAGRTIPDSNAPYCFKRDKPSTSLEQGRRTCVTVLGTTSHPFTSGWWSREGDGGSSSGGGNAFGTLFGSYL